MERWEKDITARLLNLYIIVLLADKWIRKDAKFKPAAATTWFGLVKVIAACVAIYLIVFAFITFFPLCRYGRYALATWRQQPAHIKAAVMHRGKEVNLVFGKEVYAGNGRWFSC